MEGQKGFPRWMAWVASQKWGRNIARAMFTPIDKALYGLTGGRRGLSPTHSVLYLTTIGAKTGKERRVPVLYLSDGDSYWVMASNYGTARHPGWSANLLANPQAIVQIGPKTMPVVAHRGSDEDKARLWPQLLELYPAWKSYAEWSDRNFRLFRLEPRRP